MVTHPYAVGILEDNDSLRKNIAYYLENSANYFVCFSEPTLDSLKNRDIPCDPNYILLDIHLNNTQSIDHIADLKKKFPGASVIVMTGDRNEQFILKAFENGAKGYLNKPFPLSETIKTMAALRDNGSYMSADTATKLIGLITKNETEQSFKDIYKLTERECEIVELMQEGLGYQAIADRLFISYHTVNHHAKNLYIKMDVSSRAELVAKCMKKK